MAEEIIKARVWTKVDTLENWNNNPLLLGPGEMALVTTPSGIPLNMKWGDKNERKRFSDLPFAISYDQGQFVAIDGPGALPTPEPEVAYSLVGPGTYTYPGQDDIVVDEGHWGQVVYNDGEWIFIDMGELPRTPADAIIMKGDFRATSGDTVYPVKEKLDTTIKRKNEFNPLNLIFDKTLNINGADVNVIDSEGSIIAYVSVEDYGNWVLSGLSEFDVTGRRGALFNNITNFDASPGNRVTSTSFDSDGYPYFLFNVQYQGGDMEDLGAIQVERGEQPTPYESFNVVRVLVDHPGDIINGDNYAVNAKVVKEVNDTVNKIIFRKNLFSPLFILEGFSVSVNGSDASIIPEPGSITAFVPLPDEDSFYTLSGLTAFNVAGRRGALFNSVDGAQPSLPNNRVTSTTFNGGDYKYFAFGVKYQGGSMEDLDVIQLERGVQATDYVPYTEISAKTESTVEKETVCITGASYAYDGNPWPHMAFEKLGGVGYNKAVSGENITHTAQKLYDGTLYSFEEMEDFEHFCIFHTHNVNVMDPTGRQDNYQDYEPVVANVISRPQAWDYVLKKYRADCYNLKDDPNSKWYGTPYGKPCSIVVFTNWHDGREQYNTTIREARDIYGFNLVELDTKIGFSKNQVHPVTGEQVSIIYSVDTQMIGGVVYGHHPIRTADNPVQIRIANIFVDTIKGI